jgi:hypothetical protein
MNLEISQVITVITTLKGKPIEVIISTNTGRYFMLYYNPYCIDEPVTSIDSIINKKVFTPGYRSNGFISIEIDKTSFDFIRLNNNENYK